jgi:hypothetical protein
MSVKKNKFVVVRLTEVLDGFEHLPRPRTTQTILCRGSRAECEDVLEMASRDPKNLSCEGVDVRITIRPDNGQKNTTSLRPGNGNR